jgi:ACS family pantothenate transporter-like MFS transporter
MIFGTAILVAWDVPFGLHIVGYLLAACDGPLSAIFLSWANILTVHDSQVRALTLGFMNAFGNAVTTLIQQFLYPVTDAPRYPKGFPASLGFLIGMIVWVIVVRLCELYTLKKKSGGEIQPDADHESNSMSEAEPVEVDMSKKG